MTLPVYPVSVPYSALVDSWSLDKPYQEPEKTDMEGGNVRMRTRPGDEVAEISFAVLMTTAQFETLRTFVKTDLGRGASRFTMPVWSGSAYVTKTVQLLEGMISMKPVPPKCSVNFQLRVYGGL